MLRKCFHRYASRSMRIIGLVAALCMLLVQIPVFGSQASGEVENLLVNPDWNDGTGGWITVVDIEDWDDEGQPAQRSIAYQEVALLEPQAGQKAVFSGLLAVSDQDPEQVYIQMSLSFYKADGTLLTMDSRTEYSTAMTSHEINMAIPSEAAYMRASLAILKHSVMNVFSFDDLRLTIIQTSPGGGTFVRSEGKVSDKTTEAETSVVSSEPETEMVSEEDTIADQIAEAIAQSGRISARYRRSGAIKADGSLWTWGTGYPGDGTTDSTYDYEPRFVTNDVAAVCMADGSSAIIKKDGTLWTWGNLSYGVLGNGTGDASDDVEDKDALEPIKIMDDVVKVSVGCRHCAAITSDGGLWIWGKNSDGNLGAPIAGNDTVGSWLVPTRIMDDVADVSCNVFNYGAFTAVVRKDGTLLTFGIDNYGQLGQGRTDLANNRMFSWIDEFGTEHKYGRSDYNWEPTKILEDVVCVTTCRDTAAAIKKDGTLWTWGKNDVGQLGNGGASNAVSEDGLACQTYPLQIMEDVIAVSMGLRHGVALKSDGTVWTWGSNYNGQLGIGDHYWGGDSDEYYSTPQKVDIEDVVAISAAEDYTLVLKSDGSVWAWGCGSINMGASQSDVPVLLMEAE